jgi:Ribosomal protein L11, N-terminal domain
VAEWFKAPVLKTGVRGVPWVRIPSCSFLYDSFAFFMRKIDIIDNLDWDESEVVFLTSDLLDMSLSDDVYDEHVENVQEDSDDLDDADDFEGVEFLRKINVNVPSGTAKAAPPVGPTLSQFGVDVKEFCTVFNEITTSDLVREDVELRVLVFLFKDLSLLFFIKSPSIFYLVQLSLLQKREEGFNLTALRMNRQSIVSRRRFFRSRVAVSLLVLFKIFLVKFMFECYNLPPISILSPILSSFFGSRYFVYMFDDKV